MSANEFKKEINSPLQTLLVLRELIFSPSLMMVAKGKQTDKIKPMKRVQGHQIDKLNLQY